MTENEPGRGGLDRNGWDMAGGRDCSEETRCFPRVKAAAPAVS